jgi:peptidoglycan/xylan/chitin deacetylase (PgdA/CDA1 family)
VGIARAARYFGVIEGPITNASSMISALKETPLDKLLEALEHAERDAGVDSRSLRDRYLTVADLAEVARDPLATVASHTHRHPILSHLGAADLSAEIGSGLDALRQACRTPIEFFAYPNGKRRDYDERVVASLREAGIRAAVTTAQRPLRGDDDAMALPRLGVSEGDSIAKLDLKWSVPWFSIGDLREAYWRHRSPRILWRTAS